LTPASIIPVFGSQRPYADLNFAGGSFGLDGRSVSDLTALPGFTFTRASLAMGYDATGKLVYGPNNLGLQSQTFGTGWSIVRATVSSDAIAAPDGTLTADKLTEDTSTNSHYAAQTITAPIGQSLPSIYVKAAGRTWAFVEFISGATDRYAYINLTTGAVGNGNATPTVTDAGNGWWRVSLPVASLAATTQIFVFLASANGTFTYTGDGTSGVYLWGAQLEAVTYQTTPSTYYPTTTAAYYGPRLVYDPVTLASQGILVEEARTNLCLQSQDFATTWTQDAVTVTANATTSPDGTSNADKVIETATTANHRFRQIVTVSNATAYTYSVFIKAGERTWAFVEVISGATDVFCYVNLSTGALGGTINGTWTVTGVGNGWHRVSCTFTTATTTAQAFNQLSTGNGVTSYAGDGTSGAFFYQAQLELGTGASSPIPTTTAAVTRAADAVTLTGISVPNPHSMAAEWTPGFDNASGFRRAVSLTNAGFTSEDAIYQRHTNNIVRAFTTTTMDNTLGTGNATTANKAAVRFELNNGTGSLNGAAAVAPDTSTDPTTGINRMDIGQTAGAANLLNGTISRIRIYNTALPDAQLQSLTT
jgi:hypothetical protein